jgi:hypothetical protein|tara:strand:- start:592 stop:1032 length:441 start_codon:yes stop_codon:yes gene_type:complete
MNMQTGFGGGGDNMMEQYIETMTNLMLPVIEKSTLLASEYSKACGRDTLISEDMDYAMKYCVMHTVGDTIGPSFPEIYDEVESDYSDEEIEVVSPEDCPQFERYSGSDPIFISVNEAYDNWDEWVPQNPTEELLKNAVNSNEHMGA